MEFFILFSLFCICLKISRIKGEKEKKKNIAGISLCQLKEILGSQGTLRKREAHTLHVTLGGFHIMKECVHSSVCVYLLSVFSTRMSPTRAGFLFCSLVVPALPLCLALRERSVKVNVPHLGGWDVSFHFTDENTEAFGADVLAQDHIAG